MRKVTLVLLALGLFVATAAFASNPVRISQIYGNGNTYYKCDYVELFNSSCAPVDIGGWSMQYGSSTGLTFGLGGSTWVNAALIPSGTMIPACGYYLMRFNCGTVGADLPVTPDLVLSPYTINLSGSNGKVVLFSDQILGRTCAEAKASPSYVDLVGYGTATTCFEGAGPTSPVGTGVWVRANGGRVDTDVNSADFTNQAQPYAMHNSTGGYLNPDCALACNFGACCLRGTAGACIVTTAAGCAAQLPLPGIFVGVGTSCQPTPPCSVPTTKTTWGQVKTIYR